MHRMGGLRLTEFYTQFEMGSLMFLLVLIYYFFSSRRVNSASMYIYGYYLVLTYFVMVLDILSVVFLSSQLINILFLGLQALMAPCYLLYVLSLVGEVNRQNTRALVLAILPAATILLLVVTSPWTKLIFYIDAWGRYYHGQLHFVMYVVAALYVAAAQFSAIRWRSRLSVSKKRTIGCITFIMAVLMALQMLLKEYLLVGTGVVLGQYLMYHTFQNPMGYIDASTELLNRQALLVRLRRQRIQGRDFCLLVVSMRSFRSVNDVFGIDVGDRLLRQVAKRLSELCGDANVYRFVGDVFVAALRESDATPKRLKEIQESFLEPWQVGELRIRQSVDLSLIGEERCYGDADEVVKLIEFAVADAKQRRIDGWNVVGEHVTDAMRRNIAIEQGIARAIEQNEVEMHYQPLLEVKTGGYPTFEALARLKLDDVGYVPPDEFIRVAERNGSIVRLGEVIIESVCRFLQTERPEQYGVRMAQINLSVVQCMDEDFARRCVQIMEKYGVDPKRVCLEITETAASYSDATLFGNMDALSKLGVEFALDDYGAGYSTADYAMHMPFSHVKLDKKLVNDARDSEQSKFLVCSLCELFERLGFHVVAEGVETQWEADLLTQNGAEYLQGYLFSKPLPVVEYMAFLEAHQNP